MLLSKALLGGGGDRWVRQNRYGSKLKAHKGTKSLNYADQFWIFLASFFLVPFWLSKVQEFRATLKKGLSLQVDETTVWELGDH